MKIAFLDVDNLLLDFTSFVIPYYEKHYQKSIPPDYIPSAWDFSCLSEEGVRHPDPNDIVPKNWPELLAPYKHAVSFVDQLKKNGIYVVLVTRLNQKKQLFRINNLINNSIKYDEIYFATYEQPKGSIIDTVIRRLKPEVWIYCDDKGEECVDTVMRFGSGRHRVFSLNYPYNKPAIAKHASLLAPKELIWCNNETSLYCKALLYITDEIDLKDPSPTPSP